MIEDLMKIGEIVGTLERPKGLDPNDRTGTEDIGINDVRLPRLAIAQGLSPQMTPGDGQHIPTLAMFDMFNDLSSEVYGKGPITFVPLRRDMHRMEFKPRKEGGGLIDANVPLNDPRLDWTVTEDGTRMPPKATTFTEFVIMLLRPGKVPEPIVLSIKHTNKFNRRAIDQLVTFIKMREAAIYAGLYTIQTVAEKNDNGTFGCPVVKNAGWIPVDTPGGKALYDHAAKFAASFEGKTIVTNREPGDDMPGTEPVPF